MRILQNASPFYPDRPDLNIQNGPAMSDDTVNECTTMNFANLGDGAVTQLTSIVTGVTLNTQSGVITTVSSTLAAVTSTSFTLTDSVIASTSVVLVSLGAYSGTLGTNGSPMVSCGTPSAGSVTITIYNAHATAALAGTLKINFLVC